MSEIFRKEFKYPISVLDFALLQKRLECFAQPDPYSGENGYRVRSVYFDSKGDRDLFDTLDGVLEKRKTRLRFYPPNDSNVLLEYKCKSGTDCAKKSIALSKDEARRMLCGEYGFLIDRQEPLALALYARLMLDGYRPKVVVEYNRKAYVYPVGDTRITFDSGICATYVTESFFDESPVLVPVTEPDTGVLEVKYNQFLAGVIKEVIESVDGLISANSKYAQSRLMF